MLTICMILVSCDQRSYYSANLSNSFGDNSPVVISEVFFAEDGRRVYGAGLDINGQTSEDQIADKETGVLTLILEPGIYKFKAWGIHMEHLEIEEMELRKGYTLKLKFYLLQEDEWLH